MQIISLLADRSLKQSTKKRRRQPGCRRLVDFTSRADLQNHRLEKVRCTGEVGFFRRKRGKETLGGARVHPIVGPELLRGSIAPVSVTRSLRHDWLNLLETFGPFLEHGGRAGRGRDMLRPRWNGANLLAGPRTPFHPPRPPPI